MPVIHEADMLQVLSVLLGDLLDEDWVGGPQVGRGRLVQLKLKPPPQLRDVEYLVPAPTHRRHPGPVHQRKVPEDLQYHVMGQVSPALHRPERLVVLQEEGGAWGLAQHSPPTPLSAPCRTGEWLHF